MSRKFHRAIRSCALVLSLALLTFSCQAWACIFPPDHAYVPWPELVERSPRIALAEVTAFESEVTTVVFIGSRPSKYSREKSVRVLTL